MNSRLVWQDELTNYRTVGTQLCFLLLPYSPPSIVRLEGSHFFDTAQGIFERLREHVKSASLNKVKYCLFDFAKVTGIDSTIVMLSFTRMMQWSQEQDITLVFAGLTEQLKKKFIQQNLSINDQTVKFFADADHGIEWCENEIIATNQDEVLVEKGISEQLRAILIDANMEKLVPYLQRREYRLAKHLIREGDAADFIYFVQSGQMTTQLEALGKNLDHLETIHSRRTVGEIDFFLGNHCTASG